MGIVKKAGLTPEAIAAGRTRYLANTENLMLAVIDFQDGPTTEPDPPHSHPHEQISYVAAGEIIFDDRRHLHGTAECAPCGAAIDRTCVLD